MRARPRPCESDSQGGDGSPHLSRRKRIRLKDTVRVNPNESSTSRALRHVRGRYMYHCTSRATRTTDMMRPFVVMPAERCRLCEHE